MTYIYFIFGNNNNKRKKCTKNSFTSLYWIKICIRKREWTVWNCSLSVWVIKWEGPCTCVWKQKYIYNMCVGPSAFVHTEHSPQWLRLPNFLCVSVFILYFRGGVPAVVMAGSEMIPEEGRRKTQFSPHSWATANFRSLMLVGLLPAYLNSVQFGNFFQATIIWIPGTQIKHKAWLHRHSFIKCMWSWRWFL